MAGRSLTTSSGTIREFIGYIAPHFPLLRDKPSSWPPDLFAIAASILNQTGGYGCVAKKWPPKNATIEEWNAKIKGLGRKWRKATVANLRKQPPLEIIEWWNKILDSIDQQFERISSNSDLCHALLQIIAAADEACAGIGIPPIDDVFDENASLLLRPPRSTLCTDSIDYRKVKVLPKLHTPSSGLTIRSLSHNLALVPMKEVKPVWQQGFFREDSDALNVLVCPWPSDLRAEQFCPSPPERYKPAALPKRYGLFRYFP